MTVKSNHLFAGGDFRYDRFLVLSCSCQSRTVWTPGYCKDGGAARPFCRWLPDLNVPHDS